MMTGEPRHTSHHARAQRPQTRSMPQSSLNATRRNHAAGAARGKLLPPRARPRRVSLLGTSPPVRHRTAGSPDPSYAGLLAQRPSLRTPLMRESSSPRARCRVPSTARQSRLVAATVRQEGRNSTTSGRARASLTSALLLPGQRRATFRQLLRHLRSQGQKATFDAASSTRASAKGVSV